MKKNLLYLSIFFINFIILVYEIVGAKLLSPFVGNSLFVWSSVIGVVLLSITVGYFFGNTVKSYKRVSYLLFSSLFYFIFLLVFKDALFKLFTETSFSPQSLSLLLSLVLFGPNSFLLSAVSPFLGSEILKKQENQTRYLSYIYIAGSFGAILGTFLTGFFLVPSFFVDEIILFVAFVNFVLCILFLKKKVIRLLFVLLGFTLFSFFFFIYKSQAKSLHHENSSYGFLEVREEKVSGNILRTLYLDGVPQSQSFVYMNVLPSLYAYYFDFYEFINPKERQNILMIGGGAYSYPKYILNKDNNFNLDVVEINPKVTEIAKKYFSLEENDKLNVFHQDARIFMGKNSKKYDGIFVDVFNGFSLPEHLTTKEFIQDMYDSSDENGFVIVNILGSFSGEKSYFFRSELKTYLEVFPFVDVYQVRENSNLENVQNIVLVARKNRYKDIPINTDHVFYKNKFDFNSIDLSDVKILSDNYSPVDYLNRNLIEDFIK